MLNLIQPLPSTVRRTRRHLLLAAGVGLLLGVLGVVLQETDAASALAKVNMADVNAGTMAAISHPDKTSAALALAQQGVADSLARLKFLEQRQMQREDVTNVQEIWMLRRLGGTQNAVKLQSQHWQQGQFTWDGVAAQSTELDSVLQSLNRFEGWVQAPVLVQIQSPPATPGAGPPTGLVFQLQARLHTAKRFGL